MSKTSLCIQMLELLNTGRLYKVSELASILGTNPRNILEYRKDLEEAGYFIIEKRERDGGYRLVKTCLFPVVKLSSEEYQCLQDIYTYMESKSDEKNRPLIQNTFSKILCSVEVTKSSFTGYDVEKDK